MGFPPQRGAGNGQVIAGSVQRGGNQAGVLAALRGRLLGNLQPPLPRQHRRINHIDRLAADRRQQPGQRRRLQNVRIVVGDFPLIAQGYAHKLPLPLGDAGKQPPHHCRHRHIGRQDGVHFRRHKGGVDGVAGRAPVQHGQRLLGGFNRHFPLGFLGGGAQMRRRQQARMPQQRQIAGRFVGEHIQRGARQPVAFQCCQQGVIIYQLPPRHINQTRAGLHQRQPGPGNQMMGAGSEGRVQGNKIGLRQQFLQRHHGNAQPGCQVGGDEGVVGDKAHPESGGAARHFGTDPPQPDDAQGFVADFNAHKSGTPPFPGLHGGVSLRHIARQRQHQRHRMLGGGHGVADGRVDHGDAGAGGGIQVNVVHADAGPGHHFKAASGGNDRFGNPSFAADDQGIILADGGDQLVRGEAAPHIHRRLLLQQADAFGGHIVGD